MPLQKLQFRPGVNRESTSLANEGGWFESDKVRFRSGYPEKIGGWTKDLGPLGATLAPPTGTFWGVCRSMWNWITLSGYNLLGLGTNLKYYIQNGNGGTFYDVTPLTGIPPVAITVASNAFTTTASSSGTNRYITVTCNVAGYGGQTNDFVTISGVASAVNGIPAANLNAEFQMTYVNSSTFTIQVYVDSTVTVTAGTTGAAVFAFQIATGGDVFTVGLGWGAGGWGGSTGPAFTTTLNGALAIVGNSILSANLNATATTISVASTATLAASGTVLIDSEIITYSGVTATTLTGCTRATSGSIAASHVAATGVIQYATSTINVVSASTFAAAGTFAVGGEVISYSGKTSTSFTGCVRGYAGYVTAHADGASVAQYASTATGWGAAAPAGFGIGVQLRTWSQSNYGQNLVLNPRGGAIYYWVVDSNPTIFNRAQVISASNSNTQNSVAYWDADSTCPTVCNFVLVSDSSRFTVAFGTNDPTGTYATTALDPMQIRWSNQEDLLTWTPAITNQAGDYRLSHGSAIITAIQTRQEILVFTDSAIYSMQYLGPPYVWSFQILGDNLSIIGPNAVTTVNNVTYWMGVDKFYMYSGRVETLPCALRQYIYEDINLTQGFQVVSGTNEGYNEIWWNYCSANSNVVDRYVIFNHLERTWYYGTWNNSNNVNDGRTAWLDSALRAEPMATVYGTPGGSSNGVLVYHESGVDDGAGGPNNVLPINSYVQSSDFDIGDGHNYGLVWRLIPDLTFDGSTVNQPSADFTVRPRANPGANYGTSDAPTVASTQNYAGQRTYNVQQFTQIVYVRIRGRQMAFKVSSNDLGVAWQLGAPRIDVRPDGRR
jgi:hypothetical protein